MTHITQEEADRIEAESDLIIPDTAIADPTITPKPGFFDEFKGVIIGGAVSAGVFFGLGRVLKMLSRDTEEEDQEDDLITPDDLF